MFRQLAQDHFILYLMLMAILGLLLGFVGTLFVAVILYWHRFTTFMFDLFSMGWT